MTYKFVDSAFKEREKKIIGESKTDRVAILKLHGFVLERQPGREGGVPFSTGTLVEMPRKWERTKRAPKNKTLSSSHRKSTMK